jgi:two-component system osmolarity sensor histidine kinase EnvZ
VDIRHRADHPRSGFWVRLNVSTAEPSWLFVGPHSPFGGPGPLGRGKPPFAVEPWTLGLLVSFAVVFVGGMCLLWRVQVPLRKLEKALRQFGPSTTPSRLQASGPREVRELAEQFNRMTDRLQQYDRDRQEMLAGVAHDLRAPVTRLRLQLELDNSERKAAMVRNLDSVEAIVDQFLLFARGDEDEALVELDMCAYLAEVVAPYDDQGVLLALPEKDVILSIRPNSLRRAVCNLIDNAVEYGALPVTVSLLEHDDQVVLCVSDHGPGIAAADRDLALRPFTRLDDARASQGHCGLGLAIVARIAEVNGSRLELDNLPEGGLQARLIFHRQ